MLFFLEEMHKCDIMFLDVLWGCLYENGAIAIHILSRLT